MLKTRTLAVLALIALVCILTRTITPASTHAPGAEEDTNRSSVRSLGDTWRLEIAEHDGDENVEATAGHAESNFDIEEIHRNLKGLELDRRGHIKLNGLTQRRLEEALSSTELALTEYDLGVLRDSIRGSLPDEIGREASELLLTYFRYLRAKEQMLKKEHLLVDLQDMKAHQASIRELRVALLGADTAKRLFRKIEDDRDFMLASMALSGNGDLSPEERTAYIERLREQYHQHAPPIESWSSRSHRFLERLRASGIPVEQLKLDAHRLLIREFSEEEIDLMREYRVDLFEQLGESVSTSTLRPVSAQVSRTPGSAGSRAYRERPGA